MEHRSGVQWLKYIRKMLNKPETQNTPIQDTYKIRRGIRNIGLWVSKKSRIDS